MEIDEDWLIDAGDEREKGRYNKMELTMNFSPPAMPPMEETGLMVRSSGGRNTSLMMIRPYVFAEYVKSLSKEGDKQGHKLKRLAKDMF